MQNNRNTGGLVGGAVLIAVGLFSLAGRLFENFNWGFVWPFVVIGAGAIFFVAMFAGGKQAAGFAIPGSIIGGIGLVLLFQNIVGHWESMSYFWTFIVFFVGVGIYIMGLYGGDAGQKQSGWRVMKIGIILFIIFGSFFELLFFSSFNKLVFPVLLILLGGYLVLSRSGLFTKRNADEAKSDDALPPSS
jgi:hypothetical protein